VIFHRRLFVFKLLFSLQGLIQGPGEFAEGLAIGARSLFGHTVGTLIRMYIVPIKSVVTRIFVMYFQ